WLADEAVGPLGNRPPAVQPQEGAVVAVSIARRGEADVADEVVDRPADRDEVVASAALRRLALAGPKEGNDQAREDDQDRGDDRRGDEVVSSVVVHGGTRGRHRGRVRSSSLENRVGSE